MEVESRVRRQTEDSTVGGLPGARADDRELGHKNDGDHRSSIDNRIMIVLLF